MWLKFANYEWDVLFGSRTPNDRLKWIMTEEYVLAIIEGTYLSEAVTKKPELLWVLEECNKDVLLMLLANRKIFSSSIRDNPDVLRDLVSVSPEHMKDLVSWIN